MLDIQKGHELFQIERIERALPASSPFPIQGISRDVRGEAVVVTENATTLGFLYDCSEQLTSQR
jgi:hypothetical protein